MFKALNNGARAFRKSVARSSFRTRTCGPEKNVQVVRGLYCMGGYSLGSLKANIP